jgi:Ser/Thr protein kinase RdoA (MazF antagonist)
MDVLPDPPREAVAVADLDFMGNRPRVDDLALTLYFTDEEIQLAHAADRPAGASPPCGRLCEPTPRR